MHWLSDDDNEDDDYDDNAGDDVDDNVDDTVDDNVNDDENDVVAWPGQGGVAEKINQDNHQLSASQLNLSLHQFGDNVNNGDRDNGEDSDVGGFVFLQASISPLIPILW